MRLRFIVPILFGLSSCLNNENTLLQGKWQVKKININGTTFDSTITQNWGYVFFSSGQYTAQLSGTDTGIYRLKENIITLSSTLKTNAQSAVFQITLLDSLQLVLQSTDSNNIQLHLQKTYIYP